MQQQNAPHFHHRESRTHIGTIIWLPAGYDPDKPELVGFGYGKAGVWATAKQGLALAEGWRVRAEVIGETSATLLVTDVLAKTNPAPVEDSDDGDSDVKETS